MNRSKVVSNILVVMLASVCMICLWITSQSQKTPEQLFIILLGFLTVCFLVLVAAIRAD